MLYPDLTLSYDLGSRSGTGVNTTEIYFPQRFLWDMIFIKLFVKFADWMKM